MKTEGLTWAEAIKAYANGERIRDTAGQEYWLEENSHKSNEDQHGIYNCPPFSLVKPGPKKLRFEEAVEVLGIRGSRLLVRTLVGDKYTFFGSPELSPTKEDLSFLDLAERRGWPITLVEEE